MDTVSESNIYPPAPLSEREQSQQYFVNHSVTPLLAANHVINTLIDKGSRILYGKYLRSRMPIHYGGFFGTAMEELTHQEVAAYDPGESVDSYIINWGEEDEPETAPIDSWCPVWVKMAQPHPATKTHSLNSLSSVAESLQSGKNRSKKRLSIIKSQQNLKKSGDFRGSKNSVEIEEDEPKFYKIPGMEKPYDDDKESEELRREREEQRRLKLVEAQEKKQQQIIEREKEDKKKKTENQLKNKEYTFDYAGNPVFLTRSVKVAKLPNNETVVPKFDLNVDLKVVKCLPDDPPVRENKKDEDEDKNKISLSFIHHKDEYDHLSDSKKPKEGAQYLLPVTGNINEILNVRPGVRMTIDELVREGPEFQKTDKMRRDQYLKSLDERRQERLGYYKRIMDNPLIVDGVINEDEEHPEVMKNKLLAIQLRKLGDLGGLMEIEIHEQEQFIQMLLEDAVADPKALLEQMKRKERAQKKLEMELEEQEEAKRANVIENRVNNYQTPKKRVSGLPPIEGNGKKTTDRPATTKASSKPTNIQKAFDAYNRQLLEKEWEDKNNLKPAVVGTIAQKISPDKKAQQKAAIFGGQIPKEPRERVTVGQKKLLEIVAPTFPSPKSGMNETQTPKDKIKTIFQSPTSKDGLLSAKKSPGYKLDSGKKEKEKVDENSQSKTKILVRPTTLVGDKPSSNSGKKALANQSVEVRGSKK